jgi:hypothetical protein
VKRQDHIDTNNIGLRSGQLLTGAGPEHSTTVLDSGASGHGIIITMMLRADNVKILLMTSKYCCTE